MDISYFFGITLPQLTHNMQLHPVAPLALVMSVVMSVAGTALILQVTGLRSWLAPLCYFMALFTGAYITHSFIGGLPLPALGPMPQVMLTTILGMTLGTFAILSALRPAQR